jgi:hypothetical protein
LRKQKSKFGKAQENRICREEYGKYTEKTLKNTRGVFSNLQLNTNMHKHWMTIHKLRERTTEVSKPSGI